MHYQDPDYFIEHGLTKVNITATSMTSHELTIQFDFPDPFALSSTGYKLDEASI